MCISARASSRKTFRKEHPRARRGAVLFTLAVFTLPGCMTVYAVEGNESVLRNPVAAFRRAWSRRAVYLRASVIALVSIVLPFAGLLGLLIGFLYTSVWAWEVVGYAFTVGTSTSFESSARSRLFSARLPPWPPATG